METTFTPARDAEEMAARLIRKEAEFAHLQGVFIFYCYTDKQPKVHGGPALATAEVVRGKNAHLFWRGQGKASSAAFFRMVIWEEGWDDLDEEQKIFVITHELRHFQYKVTKNGKKETIRPHDFELFYEDLDNPVMPSVCNVVKRVQARDRQPALDLGGSDANE